MTNEQKRKLVLDKLEELSIDYTIVEHKAVYTMEEVKNDGTEKYGEVVKNLFLKEHGEERYVLVVCRSDKACDIKSVRRYLGIKPLSFADEEQLMRMLGVTAGSVSPLCVMNDSEGKVSVVIDDSLRDGGLLGVHPMENTSTVFISYKDLEKFSEAYGHMLINMEI